MTYKRSTILRAVQPKEGDIQGEVLRFLRSHVKVAWARRVNTGAAKLKGFYVRFGWVGCSDIIGQLTDGRFLALEVKKPNKVTTKDQQLFLDRVNRHNGLAACVHSLEEVDAVLKNGKPNPLEAAWPVRIA